MKKQTSPERSCFVMIPFAKRFSATYATIKQAAKDCQLGCLREDENKKGGQVADHIREHIKSATVCIADLTGLNPNVIYEVALAHAARKPVILITREKPEMLPFDLRHFRALRYEATPTGHRTLRKDLKASIQSSVGSPGSPTRYLEEMLVPPSLGFRRGPFVVAASPLSWRGAAKAGGGYDTLRPTDSDHIGIRGLIQAFGLIYGLDRLPDLLNPDDYADKVATDVPMHLYCIGSPKANRWTRLVLKAFYQHWTPRLEFKADPHSSNLQNIRVRVERNDRLYEPNDADYASGNRFWRDFGLVIRGPSPRNSRYVLMVLAGRSSLGTEAACRAATDPDHVRKIKELLKSNHGIALDNHKKPFWAVVTMKRERKRGKYETDLDSFCVDSVQPFRALPGPVNNNP